MVNISLTPCRVLCKWCCQPNPELAESHKGEKSAFLSSVIGGSHLGSSWRCIEPSLIHLREDQCGECSLFVRRSSSKRIHQNNDPKTPENQYLLFRARSLSSPEWQVVVPGQASPATQIPRTGVPHRLMDGTSPGHCCPQVCSRGSQSSRWCGSCFPG